MHLGTSMAVCLLGLSCEIAACKEDLAQIQPWAALHAPNVYSQVLKNLTNIFTLGGDYYFYGRVYNWGVWGCMGLMILSALCG